jgi:hypothetical protein
MDPMVLDNDRENKIFLENYLGLLNGLSKEYKMQLVEKLNLDIAKEKDLKNDWIDALYGSFVSDRSAEDMISEIRSARRFTRKIKGFK